MRRRQLRRRFQRRFQRQLQRQRQHRFQRGFQRRFQLQRQLQLQRKCLCPTADTTSFLLTTGVWTNRAATTTKPSRRSMPN
mmetsp:Transcript_1409/g.5208  ORF Transcript_1409/g.5208 Transcript_1409/m.5208 type:complete len:81 (+) Transcript_1409:198-440(+)